MEQFIGTKRILAKPMTRQEYNSYRGWKLPDDENGDDTGYLVEYVDGGQSNHPDHAGYISWSPTEVFEKSYQYNGKMNFGHALEMLKAGFKVARSGWNGKDQFIYLIRGNELQTVLKYGYGEYLGEPIIMSAVAMKTTKNQIQVGWLASQTDMLAEDWMVV